MPINRKDFDRGKYVEETEVKEINFIIAVRLGNTKNVLNEDELRHEIARGLWNAGISVDSIIRALNLSVNEVCLFFGSLTKDRIIKKQ